MNMSGRNILLDADKFILSVVCSFLNQPVMLRLRSVCKSVKVIMESQWLEYDGLEFTQTSIYPVTVPYYEGLRVLRRCFKTLFLITRNNFSSNHLVCLPNITSFKWYNSNTNNTEIIDHILEFTTSTSASSLPSSSTSSLPSTFAGQPCPPLQSTLKSFKIYVSYYVTQQLIDTILTKLTFLEDLAVHAHVQPPSFKQMLGGLHAFDKLTSLTLTLFGVKYALMFSDWIASFPHRKNMKTLCLCILQYEQGDNEFSLREFIRGICENAPKLQNLKVLCSSYANKENVSTNEKSIPKFTYIQLPYRLSSADESNILRHILNLDTYDNS